MIGIAFPFLSELLESRGANSDIAEIFRGGIVVRQEGYGDSTMSYRFGWVLERFLHMKNDIVKLLFGLGWYPDNNNTPYNFILGLKDINGNKVQLTTPDIAYGNLLSKMGLIGSIAYLSIVTYLIKFFYKNKSIGAIALSAFIVMGAAIVEGLTCSSLSDPNWLVFFLFLFHYVNKKSNAENINSNSYL